VARLPLIDPETTSGDIRASFDRMPVKLNIFRMMAHAEANMIPAMRLGNSILHRGRAGRRCRRQSGVGRGHRWPNSRREQPRGM
jgi:hypothetical protein